MENTFFPPTRFIPYLNEMKVRIAEALLGALPLPPTI